jgi:TPR repeat protein
MYARGQGVPQDFKEALKWYKLAAEDGLSPSAAPAQYNLGVMYKNGQGVVQDYSEAVKWYKRAASKGQASAQVNLGLMYERGEGVSIDNVRAHMWLNLAAASGNASAATTRDVLAIKMNSQQIAEAQKLARECEARKFYGC